jgi:hypothetical protein
MWKTACAVLVATAVAGCGGGEKAATSPPASAASPRVWDESQVLRLAGIEAVDDGLSYRLKAHPDCTAAVVMTTAAGVRTHASAGDTVATNPDGSAGVKVVAAEAATCLRLFTVALRAVR